MELERLIQEQGEAIAEFKKANDKRLAELEKKGFSSDDLTAKLARVESALEKLDQEYAEMKLRANSPGAGGQTEDELEKKQFLDFVRKANYSSSDTQGGFAVPKPLLGKIVNKRDEISDFRGIVDVVSTGTDAYQGVRLLGQLGASWVGEISARSETTARTFGSYSIPVRELVVSPLISQSMLDDAYFDVEAWLTGEIAARVAYKEGESIVAGDGVIAPRGFTTYPTAATADDTRDDGKLEHVKSGANGAFAGSNPGDVLITLQERFKNHFAPNLTWIMSREVREKVRQLKNSVGGYLWVDPDYKAGAPAMLLGNPVVISQSMPTLATGSLSLALGDFKQGYRLVDRMGIRVIRDIYSNKPYVGFFSTVRMGGDVVDFEAIKFLKFSA